MSEVLHDVNVSFMNVLFFYEVKLMSKNTFSEDLLILAYYIILNDLISFLNCIYIFFYYKLITLCMKTIYFISLILVKIFREIETIFYS